MKSTKFQLMTVLMLCASLTAFSQSKWVAPANAVGVKNPVESNATTLAEAKTIYKTTCAPCHGDKGRGDGAAAVALNPKPADHSSKEIQAETDGSLFWKMTTGKGAMQSYKAQFTDKQRWELVNYIRTLKRK
ncbi:MAG: cytochrome c [Bacteroidota bacterium]